MIYLVPRGEADRNARRDKPTSKTAKLRYFRIDEVDKLFARYRDNFALQTGSAGEEVDCAPGP